MLILGTAGATVVNWVYCSEGCIAGLSHNTGFLLGSVTQLTIRVWMALWVLICFRLLIILSVKKESQLLNKFTLRKETVDPSLFIPEVMHHSYILTPAKSNQILINS